MTLIARLAILLYMLPLPLLAQYGGGNGKGEASLAASSIQLNGTNLSIYGGGDGRGEAVNINPAAQLDGKSSGLYGGGDGRGETVFIQPGAQLNGQLANLYCGGDGRGETMNIYASAELDGNGLSLYGGGNGRGETVDNSLTSQLNGSIHNIYGGGNGRGETAMSNSSLQLDGLVAGMFFGGDGRGEIVSTVSTIALPITLLNFSAAAQGDKIKVQWATSSEINTASFTIEKSADANNWSSITSVKAAGNSSRSLSYFIYDLDPLEGFNYYRLRSTDIDGKFTYSGVAMVTYHAASISSVSVYPNPVRYQFTVSVNINPSIPPMTMSLMNGHGQTILARTPLNANKQTVDISGLVAGVYYLMIEDRGKLSTIKVVKE